MTPHEIETEIATCARQEAELQAWQSKLTELRAGRVLAGDVAGAAVIERGLALGEGCPAELGSLESFHRRPGLRQTTAQLVGVRERLELLRAARPSDAARREATAAAREATAAAAAASADFDAAKQKFEEALGQAARVGCDFAAAFRRASQASAQAREISVRWGLNHLPAAPRREHQEIIRLVQYLMGASVAEVEGPAPIRDGAGA